VTPSAAALSLGFALGCLDSPGSYFDAAAGGWHLVLVRLRPDDRSAPADGRRRWISRLHVAVSVPSVHAALAMVAALPKVRFDHEPVRKRLGQSLRIADFPDDDGPTGNIARPGLVFTGPFA
jgi:hypothetical protein